MCHIRGRHARDAPRLPQILGADAGKLFAGFQRQARQILVAEILRDERLLVPRHVPDHPVLPCDITRVFDLRFQPLGQHGGDPLSPADELCHQRVRNFRAAEQLFGNAALGGRGKPGFLHGSPELCRAEVRLMQAAALGFQNVLGVLVLCPAVILHQAVFPADGGQALVSVVLPQGQAVLAPAGHHPVGVHDALGDQIIHQRAEVAGVPGQDELFFPQGVTGGVQSCQ